MAALCYPVFTTAADATVIGLASLEECVQAASAVFIGTVTSAKPIPMGGQICTEVTFKNLVVLLGASNQDSIVIRVNGGTYGKVRQLPVAGYPEFVLNERYALAIKDPPRFEADRYFPIVYFNQGFFPVLRDSLTGRLVMHDYDYRPLLEVKSGYCVVSQARSRQSANRGGYREVVPGARATTGHADTLRTPHGRIAFITVPPKEQARAPLDEAQFAEDVRRLILGR